MHKANRIGSGLHYLSNTLGRTDVSGNLPLASGAARNVWPVKAIALNGTPSQRVAYVHHSNSIAANVEANEQIAIVQQGSINIPEGDAIILELYGAMSIALNAGTSVAAIFGPMPTVVASLAVGDITAGLIMPVVRNGATFTYQQEVAFAGALPANWVHGFLLINTSGANESNQPLLTQLGFRTLESPLKFYDPVR